jgi:hypothetical protein
MAKLILTPPEFQVDTFEEFLQLAEKKDFRLAKAIVKAILANLNTRKRFINVMSVSIASTGETIELTADRKEFADILQKNLIHFEKQELYEDCASIKKAIEHLTLK